MLALPPLRRALRSRFRAPFRLSQHIGFIGFHNARELACFQVFRGKKSVPPTQGDIDGKSATFC